MIETRRKTGFLGFLIGIESICGIFKDFVETGMYQLKYLLTYKFSQDHLELFFGAIRSAGGFNNNPTSQQFTASYKRLLLRSSITEGRGNCKRIDATQILYLMDDTCNIGNNHISMSHIAATTKYDLIDRQPMNTDHDYCDVPNIMPDISEFKKAAISYIAGFVGMMTKKKVHI